MTSRRAHAASGDSSENVAIPPWNLRHLFFTLVGIVALAAAYFTAGRFGLSLAFLNASASAVWPPTGLALAALLLCGYRFWPGIFIGAFFVNFATQGVVTTSLAIAVGNTLEALLGAWLINRFANGCKAFERTANVFKFALLAAIISTLESASIGVTALKAGGFLRPGQFWPVWMTWWVGDAVSNLVVAPLLLIWLTQRRVRLNHHDVLEALGVLLTVVATGLLVFLLQRPFGIGNKALEYLAIPPLVWAALRFGQIGAITSAAIMSAMAISGTLRGIGPFAGPDPNVSLLLLQAFMGTITLTALVLAAVASERKAAEQRLHVQDAVSRILLEATTVQEATPRILQAFCHVGGWEFGAIWHVDRARNEMYCMDAWHLPSLQVPEFEGITRQRTFAPGVGLPGTVWSSGKPRWIPDVTRASNFPRAPYAAKEGLRAAFGFPYKVGDQVLGVLECFSREVREPDESFLKMLASIGSQLGQFMERKRLEESVRQSEQRFRGLMEQAPFSVQLFSPDGRTIAVNRAWEELWGVTLKDVRDYNILTDPQLEAKGIAPYIKRAFAGEAVEIPPIEYDPNETLPDRTRHKDARRWVSAVAYPLRNADGAVREVVLMHQDITARKRAEEMLASQARHLEMLVQERTAKLHEIINELESYSYSISHDMRAPLRAMQGYAHVLSDELGPRLDETHRRYLNRIIAASNRLDQLITDILSYSRLARGEIDLKPVDLDRLVSEIIYQYPALQNARIEVSKNLGAVMAAEALLTQAIANLLTNAVKFVAPGVKPEIQIGSEPSTFKSKPARKLFIRDNGIGIPREHQSRIFDIFHRVHSESQYEGTGIGLSIVKKAVERMNGQVSVQSEPGKGSTFWIELPSA